MVEPRKSVEKTELKTQVLGDVEAFTPAKMNRPLQAAFLAFVFLPQLYIFANSEDNTAYSETWELIRPALRLSSWQRWIQDESFILVMICLSFERMVYTLVWLFPAHFVHFAQNSPLRRIGKGRPLDVVVFLFYVSKGLQLGSIFGHYFYIGTWGGLVAELQGMSAFRLVLGLQLFFLGQFLNASIYNAIGKAGVYYGYKIGVPVPWCTGFPFNVFTMHPQYAGVVMSVIGAGLLMCTKEHAKFGFVGIGIAQALYYLFMAMVEDIPTEHPIDKTGVVLGSEPTQVRFRDLRKLEWSKVRSKDWMTTENIIGIMGSPWFSLVLAVVAVVHSFLFIVPVNLLFMFCSFRSSYSILPNACTYSFGLVLGVALLCLSVETSCPTGCTGAEDKVYGLAVNAGEIREHWPRIQTLLAQGTITAFGKDLAIHSPLMRLFMALAVSHPAPVVLFWNGGSTAALIIISFFATFSAFLLLGAAVAAFKNFLVFLYRRVYADFEPETPLTSPTESKPGFPPGSPLQDGETKKER